jgi:hypothetical protein
MTLEQFRQSRVWTDDFKLPDGEHHEGFEYAGGSMFVEHRPSGWSFSIGDKDHFESTFLSTVEERLYHYAMIFGNFKDGKWIG